MANMRAQVLLQLRDKLTRNTGKARNALKAIGSQARELRGQFDKTSHASKNIANNQKRIQNSVKQTTRVINKQVQSLDNHTRRLEAMSRLKARARERFGNDLMRGGVISAAGLGLTYAGTRSFKHLSRPSMFYGSFDAQADAVAAIARVKSGSKHDLRLRENARNLGGTTSYSAIEAAQGQEFLAMAGFDVNAIVASMESVLNLAKAGRIEVGDAGDIASDIGSAFGIEKTKEGMNRLTDTLIATTSRANTNVTMLGDTMRYAAPMARNFGASLEETSALAGVMADNGVKGTMAGTALQAIFARLAAPPTEAAKMMKRLGINARDAKGNMRPTCCASRTQTRYRYQG